MTLSAQEFLEEVSRFEHQLYQKQADAVPNTVGTDPGGVLLLTNNRNSEPIFEFLRQRESSVSVFGSKISLEGVTRRAPSYVVSYNYNYLIPEDVIECMRGRIWNLHISLLPWNRGFSPNLWSFLDGTPKGITIHQIDPFLDTGDILVQKELFFNAAQETFASTYDTLNKEIQRLFMDNWEALKTGRLQPQKQVGRGTYHCKKDLETLQNTIPFTWDSNIGDYIKLYSAACKSPQK